MLISRIPDVYDAISSNVLLSIAEALHTITICSYQPVTSSMKMLIQVVNGLVMGKNLHGQALVAHCEAWIAKFTNLLTNLATRELAELQEYVRVSSAALTQHGTSDSQQVCPALACQTIYINKKNINVIWNRSQQEFTGHVSRAPVYSLQRTRCCSGLSQKKIGPAGSVWGQNLDSRVSGQPRNAGENVQCWVQSHREVSGIYQLLAFTIYSMPLQALCGPLHTLELGQHALKSNLLVHQCMS